MSRELNSIQLSLTYATTSQTSIGMLPANAYIVDIVIAVSTAFNATGDDKIYIGTSADYDKFVNGAAVTAAGFATVTKLAAAAGVQSATAQTEIFAQYIPGGTDATAGAALINVMYAYNE
jgi:hypothetical protein